MVKLLVNSLAMQNDSSFTANTQTINNFRFKSQDTFSPSPFIRWLPYEEQILEPDFPPEEQIETSSSLSRPVTELLFKQGSGQSTNPNEDSLEFVQIQNFCWDKPLPPNPITY